MGLSVAVLLLIAHAAAIAQNPTGSPESTVVQPTDRLAWRQSLASIALAPAFMFVAYVDGEFASLLDATCEPAQDAEVALDCTAALPHLTAGQHRIAIAALHNGQESEASELVVVMMTPPATSSSRQMNAPAADSNSPRVLATGLDQAIDIAVVRAGLVVVAERNGRMLGVHHGDEGSARVQEWISANEPDRELLAIAATGSHLFAVYSSKRGSATLVRFTIETDGLTARSTLLDGLPMRAAAPAAALRPGPDGKLYLALGVDAGDNGTPGDVGSWRGKILRLNADGTLPHDAPSVVYSSSAYEPRDLAWHDSALWLLAASESGTTTLTPVQPFWQTEPTMERSVGVPVASGARSLVTSAVGHLVVGSSSSLFTLRVGSPGRLEPATTTPSGLDGVVKMANHLSRVYFCTPTDLFVRSIAAVR